MNERLDYIKQLEAQITTAQSTIDGLKAQRDRVLEQAQHEEIQRLETHLSDAKVRTKDLSSAADEAWHELKTALDELMKNLREGLERLL